MIIERPITVTHLKTSTIYYALYLEVWDCTTACLHKNVLYCRSEDPTRLFVREMSEFWDKFDFHGYSPCRVELGSSEQDSRSILSQEVTDCTNAFFDRRMVLFANAAFPERLYVCEFREFWKRHPFTTEEVV